MDPFEILCGIAIAFIALYYYLTSNYDFWNSRGVPGPRPSLVFGNTKDSLLAKKHMGQYLMEVYNEYKNEAMFGIFIRKTPVLILKDPELIKDVLIKDFTKFADRGFTVHEKTEPLTQHLFHLEPKRWRPLRTNLSPVFTSGKLKEMFSLISECANHFEKYVENLADKKESVECRELTAKYTTDVIGNCVFGIEMNAMSNEDSEFRRMGRKIFTPTLRDLIRVRIKSAMPWFYDILGYIMPQSEITKFFTRVIVETMDYREKNNIVRHDFVDVLRQLKQHPDKLGDINVTDTLLAAQAFVFFIAGFETSSTTMSHALYELAINQEIQNKLREEIDQEYASHGNSLTYDNIKKMSYLDKVFRETLRKYPPVTFLMRKSMTSYTFDGTKVSIPKGHRVWIPIYAIHHDPDIYPEPKVFDPERFNDEVAQTRHAMFYLPFGDGPRNCIGARFAVHQTKIGLIRMLRNCKFETCEETQIPYKLDSKSFLLAPKGGIHLKITKIK